MRVASELLSNYQHVISHLTLTTGSNGVFDVTVDGELIYSKDRTQCHPEQGEVLALFADLMGDDVRRYGT